MKSNAARIAVTGMNAGENPGPGVPVIRALRAEPGFRGEIVGLTYDPLDPGVFMKGLCNHVYLMSYPSEGAGTLRARIQEIHDRTPLDVIIPTLDSELSAYIGIAGELKRMGISTFLPTREGLELRSKAKFSVMGERLGIPVPRGMAVTDPAVLRKPEGLDYPLMVKGQFYDAALARSSMEAEYHFRRLSAQWGLPVVIQEYIEGDEYDVTALGDGSGGLIGAVPMKKLQLTEKGKAWGGVTVRDGAMNRFIRDVMSKLKWRGPCELEIMKRRSDGSLFLLEINPRFPAWCYLSVGAGQNLPWAAVRLALGEEIGVFGEYSVGTMFLRNSIDHIYSMEEYMHMTTAGEVHRTKKIDEVTNEQGTI